MGRMIKHTVIGGTGRNTAISTKNPYFDTADTHLRAGTPECKLNSGSRAPKYLPFSCTGGVL